MLLRLLALTTALCCASPLMAASASYNASNDALFITDIGLAGKTERYRNVLLKMRALPVVLQGDARATTFSFDEATGVLHLPNVVFQGQALAGVRIEGAQFDVLAVGSGYEATPLAFPGAASFGAQATGGRGGRVITVTNLNANGTQPPAAPQDSDGDGMPDTWERANGLNPQAQDHQGTQLSMPLLGMPGYTHLEVYLHLLSEQRVREGRSQ